MADSDTDRRARRSRETEWKLSTPSGLLAGDIASLLDVEVGTAHTDTLVAAYYDTADLALARRSATLRRREGGADQGWHLKVPVMSGPPSTDVGHRRDRDEIVLPLEASNDVPPRELLDLVAAWTLGVEVQVIARLTTERTVRPLRSLTDGTLIGEWAEDFVTVHGGNPDEWSSPPRHTFTEWEIEARHGYEQECASIVEDLLTHGAARSAASSKLRQALQLDERPLPRALPHPAPERPSGADVLRDYLSQHSEAFAFQDHRVRLDLDDAVHRMRVEARRLRSALRTFAPVLDTEVLTPLRGDLEWAADVLGTERDLEVVQQRLVRVVEGLTPTHDPQIDQADAKRVLDLVGKVLEDERRRAHRQVLDAMAGPRWIGIHRSLAAVATDPPTTRKAARDARDLLPDLVERQWRSFSKRADRLSLATPAPDWHQVRIGGKRTRYAADLVAPVMGHGAKRFARRLAEVTDLLGEFQDSHLLRAQLDQLLAPGSSSMPPLIDPHDVRSMFVLGRAYSAEELAAEHLQRQFLDLWSTMKAPGHRRWTKG
jgi:CHAD domain-containing protein